MTTTFLFRCDGGRFHAYVAVFAGETPGSRGLCGHLTMTHADFGALRSLLEDADLRRGPDAERLVTFEVRE